MAKYLNLQVPSSCHENWNNMTPGQEGRYCASCQKSVTDFTQMTDTELVNYFKKHQGYGCGRFTEDQLNKNILIPNKPLPWMQHFFKFSLPAFLLSLKSTAQAQKVSQQIEASTSSKAILDSDPSSLKGVVRDSMGNPVPYATVQVVNARNTVSANANGVFLLNRVSFPCTISVSATGYLPLHLEVKEHKDVNVTLSISIEAETVVVVTSLNAFRHSVNLVGFTTLRVVTKKELKKELKAKKQEKPPAPIPSILAYPNPVNSGGMLNVRCSNLEAGNYTIEFFTLTGQLVKTTRVNYNSENAIMSVSTTQMLPSTYILRITNEKSGKHFSEQVVVE